MKRVELLHWCSMCFIKFRYKCLCYFRYDFLFLHRINWLYNSSVTWLIRIYYRWLWRTNNTTNQSVTNWIPILKCSSSVWKTLRFHRWQCFYSCRLCQRFESLPRCKKGEVLLFHRHLQVYQKRYNITIGGHKLVTN